MTPPADPPRPLRSVPRPSTDEQIFVKVTVDDKVDAVLEDQRKVLAVATEARDEAKKARSEASQAKAIAARTETAVELVGSHVAELGGLVADLSAALINRDAEAEKRSKAIAKEASASSEKHGMKAATAFFAAVSTLVFAVIQLLALLRGGSP